MGSMERFTIRPPPIATPWLSPRIHHLNCISGCPLGGLLVDGATRNDVRARLTSHCLLIETNDGLVLIDTGYGMRDVANGGEEIR